MIQYHLKLYILRDTQKVKQNINLDGHKKISLEELVDKMMDYGIEKAKKLVYLNKKGLEINYGKSY